MAKESKEPKEPKAKVGKIDLGKGVESIIKDLQYMFRKDPDVTFIKNYYKEEPIRGWVSTNSILLNLAISYPKSTQGMPIPCIAEIVGKAGTTKSTLCYTMAANIQKLGGWVLLIDNEALFTHDYAKMAGLDVAPDKLQVCQIPLIENCFKTMEETIDKHFALWKDRPLCIILDTVASTSTKVEQDALDEFKNAPQAAHARVISQWLRRKLPRQIRGKPVLILFVNQLYSLNNSNPYGEQDVSFGGKGLKHHSKIRIKLELGEKLKRHDTDIVPMGNRVRADIIKNKITHPFRKIQFDFLFGKGIEDYLPVIWMLKKHERIKVEGNYLVWGEKKFSEQKLREFFISNPDEWNKAQQLLIDVVGEIWANPDFLEKEAKDEEWKTPEADSGNEKPPTVPGQD
jgi:recombination protein RecA